MQGRAPVDTVRGVRTWLLTGAIAWTLAGVPAQALVWPDVPERVERRLASSDLVTRRAAARELATLGTQRARPLVLHALEDADDDVKLAAATSAIRLHIEEAAVAVLPWLGGPAPSLRSAACEVARALPDARAVPALARALGDTETGVRAAAAEALGAYGGNADATPPLLGKLDDPSPHVREVIVRALARLGDGRAVVPLVGKAQDSVPEVRQAVARALGDLGDPRAVQALLLQLRDNVVDVRVEALGALGKLRAADAVDSIAPLAVDRNGLLRRAAIAALGRIATPAAVHALVATLGLGDDSGGGVDATPAREALVASGAAAVADVAAVLERPAAPAAAASAAWVLGALHARDRAPAIVAAMRRGTLPTAAALHALAGAGTSESLPVVLEFVSDPNAAVHDRALEAAGALLDPSVPDGRATEPLSAALRDSRLGAAERAAIARLLGRTGAARAAPVLAGLARAKGAVVRLAAIDALGTLGTVAATRPEDLEPVLDALGDPDPGVRLHAAVALSEAGGPQARDVLLAKLDDDEVDRAAVLTALGGILARSPSAPAVARLTRELEVTAGPGRDSVIEALGRTRAPAALDALATLASGADVADVRAAASLLAAHADDPRAVQVARGLLGHRDASARAQAAWSLGTLGGADDVRPLGALFHGQPDEAIDAAGAIGRIAARAGDGAIAAPLCALTTDPRAYVRASAYSGLAIAHARCGDGSGERRALNDDPSEAVRSAVALAIARTPRGDADARALARCAAEDRAGAVAARCRASVSAPQGHPRAVTVYVVPDVASTPQAGASYVLVFGDGELRAGAADRRGAVFDPLAPDGELTLLRTNER